MTRPYIVLFVFIGYVHGMEKGDYIGCYKHEDTLNQTVISNIPSIQDCINSCARKNFKFAILSNHNNSCACNNFLGFLENYNTSEWCTENSVYSSSGSIPGPPQKFRVESITEEGVELSWDKPEGTSEIKSYDITAKVLHTFSEYPTVNTTWVYPNNTFRATLNLQPATKYNISIHSRSSDGLGNPSSQIVETLVGSPDYIPLPPEILSRNGSQMTIKITPVVNNNGPITFYRLVVLNEVANQMFELENLKSYKESLEQDLNYYIAAELTPDATLRNFIVGDGKLYGNYFNAPLFSSVNYNMIVGIVSTFNGLTKVAYSNPSKVYRGLLVNPEKENKNSTSLTVILLTTAIIILSILLIVGIVGFFILRRRIMHKHRHNRLSEQELNLQGPMISVENSAYLPEDEQLPVNHYKNLKQRIQIFNLKDELFVDAHSIIGQGRFGTICSAILRENNIPIAAYSISDKSLPSEEKKLMLKNLDMLIKFEKHDNLIELIGTSESSHMLYVLLRVFPMNLKIFLINSRVFLPNRFCNIDESTILGIITQITHGLLELERHRIYHKQLCARNIMLTDDLVPKIFGFGLADYVTEKKLDYTRWTAVEVLKGCDFNSRSPIWSFGTLLWEICALGATPYSNISNVPNLIEKISNGIRLPQLKYFNDDVYQIMLNCWQIDMGERPDCEALCRVIENLHEDTIIPFISFSLYQMFEYEQYKSDLEFKM